MFLSNIIKTMLEKETTGTSDLSILCLRVTCSVAVSLRSLRLKSPCYSATVLSSRVIHLVPPIEVIKIVLHVHKKTIRVQDFVVATNKFFF